MRTEMREMTVRGLRVSVVRKAIKNLHLGVYPPDGRIRVAAPFALSDAAVRVAVIGRLPWIKRRRASFEAQPRESPRELVDGESHFFCGRRYRLRVIEVGEGRARVEVSAKQILALHVPRGAAVEVRDRVLQAWYREQLRARVPPLLEKWEAKLGVRVRAWGIKRMKTKWGSCNASAGRVWLNLELIKKPPASLEYVLVHELAHLISRKHDQQFQSTIDRHLPAWRHARDELNAAPLSAARLRGR